MSSGMKRVQNEKTNARLIIQRLESVRFENKGTFVTYLAAISSSENIIGASKCMTPKERKDISKEGNLPAMDAPQVFFPKKEVFSLGTMPCFITHDGKSLIIPSFKNKHNHELVHHMADIGFRMFAKKFVLQDLQQAGAVFVKDPLENGKGFTIPTWHFDGDTGTYHPARGKPYKIYRKDFPPMPLQSLYELLAKAKIPTKLDGSGNPLQIADFISEFDKGLELLARKFEKRWQAFMSKYPA